MLNAPHKYPYAIDDNGKPIFIDDITQDNRRDSHYHCYGCGAELFPVLGEVREHHFRHQKDAICDPDKYLHEFAKATIKHHFDESQEFIVQYQALQICKNKSQCQFAKEFKWKECEQEGLYSLNLKDFYDTCTPEKGYYQDLPDGKKRYIADLKLTNSHDQSKAPICIEVWVTHECTEDKKQNGGRIIEIKVSSEKDAKRDLIESDDEAHPIRFFNFKRIVKTEPKRIFQHVKIMPSIKGCVVVTDKTRCDEGLVYDSKGNNEVIYSCVVQPDLLEILYAAKCNLNGLSSPNGYFCELGQSIQKNEKTTTLRCRYGRYGCPCRYYKYSPRKTEEFLKQHDIPHWEQSKLT